MSFSTLALIGVLFGIGFGFCVQRAGLCFAHGMGEIYLGRGRRIMRLFIVIFVITSIGFLLSGYISPNTGLKPIGQLRGYGFYNILSGILFGAGIALTGGCVLGTLRQIGEGNMTFVIVLAAFIPGLALVVFGLNPLLEQGYHVQKTTLPELFGVAAPYVTAVLVAGTILWFAAIRRRRS
ncbi:MAG: YeeE/YedE family protein [Planctomycetes bacterium]|nr:YeeE/YedE family protein [Planctomycetota bacterium]